MDSDPFESFESFEPSEPSTPGRGSSGKDGIGQGGGVSGGGGAWAGGGAHGGSKRSELIGTLLVAHPSLLDPNFRRTVLILSEHDVQQGAFGLILNRPTEQTVGELMEGQALGRLREVPVFIGGPVAGDQLTFAAFFWDASKGRMECRHHLGLEEAEAALWKERAVVRAFIGYAGWGRWQLERELSQQSWVVGRPTPDLFELGRVGDVWKDALVPLGPSFQLMAEAPEQLGLN
jgi:putative transcriptional regulator